MRPTIPTIEKTAPITPANEPLLRLLALTLLKGVKFMP